METTARRVSTKEMLNFSELAALYFGTVQSNQSLNLDYDAWQRLNATVRAFFQEQHHNTSRWLLEGQESSSDYTLLPITVIYTMIFVAGVVGNVSTCIVIVQNKCMHTATNYYLFTLAVSDLILLVSGLPPEVYRIWYPNEYVFGEGTCVFLGLVSETSANATVLTITAFTVERYIAICHPFLSHTMSKLSRVVKFIVAIWILAVCLAVPQAIQYGVVYTVATDRRQESSCTVKWEMVEHAFEISGFVFFVGPMTLITALYILIGIKLRTSRLLRAAQKESLNRGSEQGDGARVYRQDISQTRAIRMLVAVAVSFFLCWAPFHSQRLLAVYGESEEEPSQTFLQVYKVLTDLSGVLYFLSTAINPLLYNIMSNKFREAFRTTIARRCCTRSLHGRSMTRCISRERPATLNKFSKCKRQRIPSTNTHLSTLTCTSRNLQMTQEGNQNTIDKRKYFNRSVSGVLIRVGGDTIKRARSHAADESGGGGVNIHHLTGYRLKSIKGKLKERTIAIFSAKGKTVRVTRHQEGATLPNELEGQGAEKQMLNADNTRRESLSESDDSLDSNCSLRDVDEEYNLPITHTATDQLGSG